MKTKKQSMTQLKVADPEHLSFKVYSNKPVTINRKDSSAGESSKHALNEKKHAKSIDNNIEKIAVNKEEKLLNLIVKTIVKTTLEQLYGKESN